MPNYIIRWSDTTIYTAVVEASSREAAGLIVAPGVTPVRTTTVNRRFDRVLSVRPCVDLPQLKSKENEESPTARIDLAREQNKRDIIADIEAEFDRPPFGMEDF